MPLSAPSRRDLDGRCSRDADAAERLRSVRDRLEATVSGLGELELLRQRQEVLVRAALELREEDEEPRRQEKLLEEKLLEENILLLRKQLNCLRRRDAGLITQLQELDRQISDLRLDSEESHDPAENDSRPSSGFYELSDAASGSLSNSSNSVFSECFCSTVDADGRLLSTDELASCLECDGLVSGLCDELSSGTVRRSLSAPHPPPTLDPVSLTPSCESQSKYHCDLVARNGSDVYRYPSPLHAVAVQSPTFLHMLGHGRDDGFLRAEAAVDAVKAEPAPAAPPAPPAPPVPQSSSWPTPSSSSSSQASHKRLDSYIYSLLQRRALPIRTSRPRTSISTDPSKSILRQASLCVRSGSGPGPGLGTLRASAAAGGGAATSPPLRQWSVEEQETQNDPTQKLNTSNSLLRNKSRVLPPPPTASGATPPKDSAPKDTKPPCPPPDHHLLLRSPPTVKTQPAAVKSSQAERSTNQDAADGESHMVDAKHVPAQRQNVRARKGGKNVKTARVKSSDHNESTERKGEKPLHRLSSKKPRPLEDGGSTHIRISRRASGGVPATASRVRRLPASIPEGRVLDKHAATSTLGSVRSGVSRHHHHGNHHHYSGDHHHHHHHGRDQVVVVAKPKHKRNDYRRLRAIMEAPYDEALRRAQRRQRKELLSQSAAGVYTTATTGQMSSPYAYVAGSDSEYSAECASLFHSTIMDTSEDERSNYTANRFGDSESSEDEYVEESTATSDTEESGGGGAGAGRGWSQLGASGARTAAHEMTPAQAKAFVKIKASHHLKKKILRFRSGSLKLMTTV